MNSESESNFGKFRRKFTDFFWWLPPISFLADLIAILGLTNFKQSLPQPSPTNPVVLLGFALSDGVFVTGWVTAFVVTLIVNTGYERRQTTQKSRPLIISVFMSIFLIFLYFRLWLGDDWWMFVCVAPIIFILGLVTLGILESFSRKVKPSQVAVSPNLANFQSNTAEGQLWNNSVELPYIGQSALDVQEVSNTPGIWETTKKELGIDKETLIKDLGFDKETLKRDLFGISSDADVMERMKKNWQLDETSKESDDLFDQIRKAWGDNQEKKL